MLQERIIEESTSTWFSPIVVALKPDRSLRLCNNFRRLNALSEFDNYCICCHGWMTSFCGWGELFFSTLGLTKG